MSLRNLDVRTYDNPGIGGIDLLDAVQCKIENVFVNTGVYNVQASKPTHGTAGISTPACNNAALTILRNVVVTGYHTGILVNEHIRAVLLVTLPHFKSSGLDVFSTLSCPGKP